MHVKGSLLGLATSCSATFRQLLKFSATFHFLAFLKLFFYFFRDIYCLSKEKSAKFSWFILLCECVDSNTGPITNASLVLHAYPGGQQYHMTCFSRWRTTLLEKKARLILLRKLKAWGQISLRPKKLKELEKEKYRRIRRVKTTIKPTSSANKKKKATFRQLFRNSATSRQLQK